MKKFFNFRMNYGRLIICLCLISLYLSPAAVNANEALWKLDKINYQANSGDLKTANHSVFFKEKDSVQNLFN